MKPGDKIVCIRPYHYIDSGGKLVQSGTHLKNNKIYTVDYVNIDNVVILEMGVSYYSLTRFVTLMEHRRMKINKIVNEARR